MRTQYKNRLKQCFHRNLIRARTNAGHSQAKMAERLAMDERSYIELDHEKSCCSATTLALFLIYVCEDVDAFLQELRNAFERQ